MENQEVNPIPTPPATPQTPGTPGAIDVYPGAIMYMVFGIISVCICWFGFIPFVGLIFGIAGLIFGILAFSKGRKMQKDFDSKPGAYKPASKAFIKVATITGLVGFILSAIYIVIGLIITILAASEGFNF